MIQQSTQDQKLHAFKMESDNQENTEKNRLIEHCLYVFNNFVPGETYNIGGNVLHTIEELSDIILEISGGNKDLVKYEESEMMTTKIKNVDVTKSIIDLNHQNTINLYDGIKKTFEWMKGVYL